MKATDTYRFKTYLTDIYGIAKPVIGVADQCLCAALDRSCTSMGNSHYGTNYNCETR